MSIVQRWWATLLHDRHVQRADELDDQDVCSHNTVGQLLDDSLEASHCKGLDGAQSHASGTQMAENHADYVREIRIRKDDAHVNYHNGRSQAEMRQKQIAINTMNNGQEVDTRASGDEADDEDTYPWFSARAICHWIIERMKKDDAMYWNVDDYDERNSYQDEGMKPPKEFANDKETRAEQFHQMRKELICLENIDGAEPYEIKNEIQRKRTQGTINVIIEICKWHHYFATEHKHDDGRGATFKSPREGANTQCVTGRHHERDAQLACFSKGQTKRRPIGKRREEDDESDGEPEGMACQMTGEKWEQLPFQIIIDSGACTSVMPTSWCAHVPTVEIAESRSGEFVRAANGQKIFNEGSKIVSLMTKEGVKRDMKFTSCEVPKEPGSVSQICRAGHRVVFNPEWSDEGSYIAQLETGEVMWLTTRNGLYVLDTRVAPHNHQTSNETNTSCGRKVRP